MKSKPKFCVSEEVAVRGTYASDYDIDRTEVIAVKYVEEGESTLGFPGWRYKTAHQPDMSRSWVEESLRKIPPKDRTNLLKGIWELPVSGAAL